MPGALKRGKFRHTGERHVETEAEIGVISSANQGRLRTAHCHQKPGERHGAVPPYKLSEGIQLANTLV